MLTVTPVGRTPGDSTRPAQKSGFTLVEITVALVILSAAILGLTSSAAKLTTAASSAELRALALYSVEDRIAEVGMDTRYDKIDSVYAGVESNALGLSGFTRTTTIQHIKVTGTGAMDYKVVSVVLDGPQLTAPVSRQVVIAAP